MQQENNNNSAILTKNMRGLLILLIYVLFNFYSTYTNQKSHSKIFQKMQTNDTIQIKDLMDTMEYKQIYEGIWKQNNNFSQGSFLKKQKGIFQMRVIKFMEKQKQNYFEIVLSIIDGQYLDEGIIEYQFRCNNNNFNTENEGNQTQVLYLADGQFLDGKYDKDNILITIEVGPVNATLFNISLHLNEDDKFDIDLLLKTEHLSIDMQIESDNWYSTRRAAFKNVIFAFIMTVTSYGPFSGLLFLLSDLAQNKDSPSNYSFVTVCAVGMWDTVVCLVSLVFAFSNQSNLILFMIPSFFTCYTFTKLQPKFMFILYQKLTNPINLRQLICRFNLIHYGSLLLIYPIIVLTNFNRLFFIGICCIFFPQIYHNGLNGNRPNLSSVYYKRFLFIRYLIVFYLKCFPYNVFRFEPDYQLGIICISLLALQYALLNIQIIYGPKKIIPQFMLPPIYNYNYEEEVNLEQGGEAIECSICLMALHAQPLTNFSQNLDISYRLMKTPCKHTYHSSCLTEWMRIKKECPQCRAFLPPYE